MSNSIWKTPDQKPEEYETMLFESYEWDEPEVGNYQNGLFVPYNDESESLKSDDIEKWCYLDDLIAQADKAERLQKEIMQELDIYYSHNPGLHPADDCIYAIEKIIGYKKPKENQ